MSGISEKTSLTTWGWRLVALSIEMAGEARIASTKAHACANEQGFRKTFG